MRPITTRLTGWVLVGLFAPVAFLTLTVGWIQDGWDVPAIQCSRLPPPTTGGPFYESTRITGQRSYFPLGVDCTYDVPDDGVGPQLVHNYNRDATILLVISALGVGAGFTLINNRWLLDRVRATAARPTEGTGR